MTQLAFPEQTHTPNLLEYIDRAIRACLEDEMAAAEASQAVIAQHTAVGY